MTKRMITLVEQHIPHGDNPGWKIYGEMDVIDMDALKLHPIDDRGSVIASLSGLVDIDEQLPGIQPLWEDRGTPEDCSESWIKFLNDREIEATSHVYLSEILESIENGVFTSLSESTDHAQLIRNFVVSSVLLIDLIEKDPADVRLLIAVKNED